MNLTNFFKYKSYIEDYHGQDMFGPTHIIFMILATITIVLLCVFLRKMNHKKLNVFLKILSIYVPVMEVVKIVWESYYDIKLNGSFNYTGLLPLYTCSMYMYVLIVAAWSTKKPKDYCLAWLSSVGIIGGLTNFYYTQMLNYYPFFSFATFMSLQYHFLMVITGLLIIVTKYKKIDWKDINRAFVTLLAFSIIVIPIDYIFKFDYMFYYSASGIPVLNQIASFFVNNNLRFIYTLVMLFFYLVLASIPISIYKLINYLNKKNSR